LSLKELAAETGLSDAALLFSESNTRFLVEVPTDKADEFTRTFEGLPLSLLGTVTNNEVVQVTGQNGDTVISTNGAELKESWQAPLRY